MEIPLSSPPDEQSSSTVPKVVAALVVAAAVAAGAYVAGNSDSTLRSELQTALAYDASMPGAAVPAPVETVLLKQIATTAQVYGGP